MGWNLKKKFKKAVKKVGDWAESAVDAQLQWYTGGQYGTDEAKATIDTMTGKEAAEYAKMEAQQQQAAIAAQEKEIARKQADEDKIATERKKRMGRNLLLSGSETGTKSGGISLLSSGA